METTHKFEVNGNRYVTTRLPAMKQFSLLKRFAPFIAIFATKDDKNLMVKLTEAIQQLDDPSTEYVIITCLSCTLKQMPAGTGLTALTNNGRLMFQDMPLIDMLVIAKEVIAFNLQDFFGSVRQLLPQAPEETNQHS